MKSDIKIKRIVSRVLNEALGVPDNIIETSENLYNDIFSKLKTYSKDKFKNPRGAEFVLANNYQISDVLINRVVTNIIIQPHEKVDEIILAWSRIGGRHSLDSKTLRIKNRDFGGEILLAMNFIVPLNWEYSDFINYFSQNRNSLTSSISHELMHSFEHVKKPSYKVEDLSDYGTYSGLRFGIPAIDEFIQNLYYIHQIENTVRPTEVATLLKLDQVKKKDFLNFLMSNKTYKRLKKISNFSIDDFKSKIKRNIIDVDKVLDEVGELQNFKTDDEKVERILELLLINLVNTKMEDFEELITNDPFEKLFGYSGEKAKKFQKYLNSLSKFKTPDQFLQYEQERFKEISLKMIKKISKLYDMAQDDVKKESINDWDLYHKINETEKKNPITNKLKYPSNNSQQKAIKNIKKS